MPEGETLTGSLTPTALLQAAKQLPEDLLGPFAVRSGQRGAAHRSQPHFAAASFSLHLKWYLGRDEPAVPGPGDITEQLMQD